ncbi:MAG TPA: hypothetical protein VMV46_02375, partial [Thermoanaerobaculia bacterium]|nr:hypothetical protein [Thermoanaerobaculia bacterium]
MQRTWWAPRGMAPDGDAGGGAPPAPWTAAAAARIVAAVASGSAALRELPEERLLAAWSATVAAFRDPGSAERQALDPSLTVASRLSAAGLGAGLEAGLGGVA